MNLVAVGGMYPPGLVGHGAGAPDSVLRTIDARMLARVLQRFRGKRIVLSPPSGPPAPLPADARKPSQR